MELASQTHAPQVPIFVFFVIESIRLRSLNRVHAVFLVSQHRNRFTQYEAFVIICKQYYRMENAQHGAGERTSDLLADIFCAKLRPIEYI